MNNRACCAWLMEGFKGSKVYMNTANYSGCGRPIVGEGQSYMIAFTPSYHSCSLRPDCKHGSTTHTSYMHACVVG